MLMKKKKKEEKKRMCMMLTMNHYEMTTAEPTLTPQSLPLVALSCTLSEHIVCGGATRA